MPSRVLDSTENYSHVYVCYAIEREYSVCVCVLDGVLAFFNRCSIRISTHMRHRIYVLYIRTYVNFITFSYVRGAVVVVVIVVVALVYRSHKDADVRYSKRHQGAIHTHTRGGRMRILVGVGGGALCVPHVRSVSGLCSTETKQLFPKVNPIKIVRG